MQEIEFGIKILGFFLKFFIYFLVLIRVYLMSEIELTFKIDLFVLEVIFVVVDLILKLEDYLF